jgi:hypothetical protein
MNLFMVFILYERVWILPDNLRGPIEPQVSDVDLLTQSPISRVHKHHRGVWHISASATDRQRVGERERVN